jgi:hypothetical protein
MCLFCVCVGSSLAKGRIPRPSPTDRILGLRNYSETKRFMDALWLQSGSKRIETDLLNATEITAQEPQSGTLQMLMTTSFSKKNIILTRPNKL